MSATYARILGLAEALPGGVFDALEDLGHVARVGDLGEAVEPKHARTGRGNERRVGGRCDLGDQLEQADVLRRTPEVVIANQHPVRLAAELAILLLVDLLEQGALIEFRGFLQVLGQVTLADVQHPDLEGLSRFRLVDQVVEAAPASLQLLKVGMVHDLIELIRQFLVDRGDPGQDVLLDILGYNLTRLHNLIEELPEVIPRTLGLDVRLGTGRRDDLLEQVWRFLEALGRCGRLLLLPAAHSVTSALSSSAGDWSVSLGSVSLE